MQQHAFSSVYFYTFVYKVKVAGIICSLFSFYLDMSVVVLFCHFHGAGNFFTALIPTDRHDMDCKIHNMTVTMMTL